MNEKSIFHVYKRCKINILRFLNVNTFVLFVGKCENESITVINILIIVAQDYYYSIDFNDNDL